MIDYNIPYTIYGSPYLRCAFLKSGWQKSVNSSPIVAILGILAIVPIFFHPTSLNIINLAKLNKEYINIYIKEKYNMFY